MALSIKKILLQTFVIPGTVFCACTLPLAVLGSEPVVIEFQEERIFAGQLREIASPYLIFATALSIGTGFAAMAIAGWQQSSQKYALAEQELLDLQQALKEKEIELENIKLSDSRLAAFGLSSFLEDDIENSPEGKAKVETLVPVEATTKAEATDNVDERQTNPPSHLSTMNSSVSSQIQELNSQLAKINAHVASLQHEVQTTPMVVAENA